MGGAHRLLQQPGHRRHRRNAFHGPGPAGRGKGRAGEGAGGREAEGEVDALELGDGLRRAAHVRRWVT